MNQRITRFNVCVRYEPQSGIKRFVVESSTLEGNWAELTLTKDCPIYRTLGHVAKAIVLFLPSDYDNTRLMFKPRPQEDTTANLEGITLHRKGDVLYRALTPKEQEDLADYITEFKKS